MNANELRVGNWVEANSPMMQVKEITEHTVGLYMPGSEADPFLYDIDEINPIPLSPEILEKFGFGKDISSQYGGYLIKVKEGESIRIVNDESIGWHWPMNGYNRPITNYVHQLQNLIFALTGEELTYKQ
jgi:hypothetical protein